MKSVLLLIILCLVMLFSCNETNKKNYIIIERILKNTDKLDEIYTDKLDEIYTDTSCTTISYKEHIEKLKTINSWEDKLSRDSYHIKKFFSDGYSIERDEVLPFATPLGKKGVDYHYYVHLIELRSKIDSTKILRFKFSDEKNNKDWRLDYISIVEAPY